MKYKRLHRISHAKAKKFFALFEPYITEDYENTFKVLGPEWEQEYIEVKKKFDQRKFGQHLLNRIDALRKKFKLTFDQLLRLVYTPKLIGKLVYSSNPLLDLIKPIKDYFHVPVIIPINYGS